MTFRVKCDISGECDISGLYKGLVQLKTFPKLCSTKPVTSLYLEKWDGVHILKEQFSDRKEKNSYNLVPRSTFYFFTFSL